MFAIVLDDINEQLEVNKMLIDKINSHTHEEEFISYTRRYILLNINTMKNLLG